MQRLPAPTFTRHTFVSVPLPRAPFKMSTAAATPAADLCERLGKALQAEAAMRETWDDKRIQAAVLFGLGSVHRAVYLTPSDFPTEPVVCRGCAIDTRYLRGLTYATVKIDDCVEVGEKVLKFFALRNDTGARLLGMLSILPKDGSPLLPFQVQTIVDEARELDTLAARSEQALAMFETLVLLSGSTHHPDVKDRIRRLAAATSSSYVDLAATYKTVIELLRRS